MCACWRLLNTVNRSNTHIFSQNLKKPPLSLGSSWQINVVLFINGSSISYWFNWVIWFNWLFSVDDESLRGLTATNPWLFLPELCVDPSKAHFMGWIRVSVFVESAFLSHSKTSLLAQMLSYLPSARLISSEHLWGIITVLLQCGIVKSWMCDLSSVDCFCIYTNF